MKRISEYRLIRELREMRDRIDGFIGADMKDMDTLNMIGLDISSLAEYELKEGFIK